MTLYWLVQGCQPGDSMVFHVSGRRIYITRCLAPWISKLREGLWMMISTQQLLDPQMSPLNRSMYRCSVTLTSERGESFWLYISIESS
ncbi:unnamed protein product, partial [Vitis vinifera]